jgi:hypothetical protein
MKGKEATKENQFEALVKKQTSLKTVVTIILALLSK